MISFRLSGIGFILLFILAMAPKSGMAISGVAYEFNVDDNREGWGRTNSISALTVSSGTLQCTVVGEDPNFESPLFSVNPADNPVVLIRLKVQNPGICQIYWETIDEGSMDEAKKYVFPSGEADEWRLLVLNMGGHPKWSGVIRQLRIDPPESAGQIEVDYVRICSVADIPAILSIESFAITDQLALVSGQPFNVTARIKNTGGQPAINVQAALSTPAELVLQSSPAVQAIPTLAGGQSIDFVWTLSSTGDVRGAISLSVTADGQKPLLSHSQVFVGTHSDIYIVKERVEVTSDWSILKWISGPAVLAYRYEVLEGKTAIKNVEVMGLDVVIVKDGYDATRVVVEVEAIIARGLDEASISLDKGHIGRTTISLQVYSPATASFREVFTTWREMMPPFSFNVDVSSIYGEKCSTASFQDALPSIKGKVFSFYYPWFGNPDGPSRQWYAWEGVTREDIFNADNYPLMGPYDSKDTGVLLAHMEMAKQAGIDGFIVSWWGINDFTDRGMGRILQAAAETGMEISIYYETVRYLTPQQMIEELTYAVREYGGNPAFMKDQGRPVVFIYAPGYLGRDSKFWVQVR
ncbi:MAG: hypothetical protein NTY03_03860 [Candidatus Bathyarchaeota archaeon]|nr:hypothetical protein [Candidatus Bathyarchaeota archaeon]